MDIPKTESDTDYRERLAAAIPLGAVYTAEEIGNSIGSALDAIGTKYQCPRKGKVQTTEERIARAIELETTVAAAALQACDGRDFLSMGIYGAVMDVVYPALELLPALANDAKQAREEVAELQRQERCLFCIHCKAEYEIRYTSEQVKANPALMIDALPRGPSVSVKNSGQNLRK